MATISDLKFDALREQGHTGSLSDMTLQWLQANGATSNVISDAWVELLSTQLGELFTGNRNDDWFALLGSLGYTGSISDREYAFWADYIGFGSGAIPIQIESTSTYANSSPVATNNVTLPSDLAVDDVLVLFFKAGSSTATLSMAGWDLLQNIKGVSGQDTNYIWTRVVDGTEGATAAVIFASGTTRPVAAICYRISGVNPARIASASFMGNTTNPPSVSAPWGADDNLFLAAVGYLQPGTRTLTSPPTNYSDGILVNSMASTNTDHCAQSTAHRFVNAASDDPDVFTYSSSPPRPMAAIVVLGPA